MCVGFSSLCFNPGLAFALKCKLAVTGDPEPTEQIHAVDSSVCEMEMAAQMSAGGDGH